MNQLLNHVYDPEEFRREGHKLVDLLTSYLQECKNAAPMPVLPSASPDDLLNYWTNDFSKNDFNLQDYFATVISQSNHIHHPRYMGHQVVPPAPLSALSELLEALLNNGMAVFEMGPASTAIERVILKWLADKAGMPQGTEGILTSGGSAGNLTGLLAARQVMRGHTSREDGLNADLKPALMVSEEAHYSIARATQIMGWGETGIVKVPVNKRMQLDATRLGETLDEARSRGLNVIALVGNACTTSTGTYDPLDSMADFAEANKLWFHVDGAHGGAAFFSEKYRHHTTGIHRADSLVIDFHKMMLSPALTTAVLFRNGQHSYETFAQKAEYLLGNSEKKPWYDSAGRALECTKKMMGIKVYALVKLYGDQLFSDYITKTYDLGQTFAELVNGEPEFELALPPDGNIVCFRYHPAGFSGDVNAFTVSIRKKLLGDARFYVVQTNISGQVFLRATLMNPFTTPDDLKTLLALIKEMAEQP